MVVAGDAGSGPNLRLELVGGAGLAARVLSPLPSCCIRAVEGEVEPLEGAGRTEPATGVERALCSRHVVRDGLSGS